MSWNLTENHQGENLSHSGYGAQQVQSDRIMLPGLPEYLKLHSTDERVVGIDLVGRPPRCSFAPSDR